MDKPCYEDFVNELPVKCLEGTETGKDECLVLENGGCWNNCNSGKQNEFYKISRKAEKAKLAKAQEIREEIFKYFKDNFTGLIYPHVLKNKSKSAVTKIIRIIYRGRG